MATSGDRYLATNGDFSMATDTREPPSPSMAARVLVSVSGQR
jgi:hypothetical protein